MVGTLKNDTKFLRGDWHRNRQRIRETVYHVENVSDADRIEFDITDSDTTGRAVDSNYKYSRAVDVFNVNGTDVRELRDR